VVTKLRGESLGIVVVESGWGSMVPTVVLANMNSSGAAARCNELNIGDQLLAINGVSLVGLPLSSCQNYIKVIIDTHKHITICQLCSLNQPFCLAAITPASGGGRGVRGAFRLHFAGGGILRGENMEF